MTEFRLLYSETAANQIKKCHPELKAIIRRRLDKLKAMPRCGKKLERELAGYRSLRAKRYRIIYKLKESDGIIEIHHIGHRRDIYELIADNLTDS